MAKLKKNPNRKLKNATVASGYENIQIHRNFLPLKQALRVRSEFDSVYADARSTQPKRFLWDHWELPDQYRMHRTLAREFFSPKAYSALKDQLVRFGQDHLGCHSISEPWLSYYTEGDEQHLHTDSPHGPWAYVYSLTDWDAAHFTGGETFILRPETLNYWASYSRARGREFHDLNMVIPPRFNQLVVFDPRLPHGVRRVSGTHDPRKSRLVVHGWFVNPEPFVVGALELSDVTHILNRELGKLLSDLALSPSLIGMIVLRLHISPNGKVRSSEVLTNTLVETSPTVAAANNGASKAVAVSEARSAGASRAQSGSRSIGLAIGKTLSHLQFSKAAGSSTLTLPLIFD